MLKHRILTSLVLAPAALGLVFFTPLAWFSAIAAALVLLGAWEWAGLMGITAKGQKAAYTAAVAAIVANLALQYPIETLWQTGLLSSDVKTVFYIAAGWWAVATVLVCVYPKSNQVWYASSLFKILAGFFTLVPMWLGLNVLRSYHYADAHYYGSWLIVAVLGIVWAADIGAYFVGKQFGKHKLMPNVSPNKTIEGLLGGVGTATVFALVFSYYVGVKQELWLGYAIAAALLALASAFGDLMESMFKREAGLKDSGKLLPGHGGILDRIDSLTAAIPLFILAWLMIN